MQSKSFIEVLRLQFYFFRLLNCAKHNKTWRRQISLRSNMTRRKANKTARLPLEKSRYACFFIDFNFTLIYNVKKDRGVLFMSMKDKMHTGELYLPNDSEIFTEQLKRLDLLAEFNALKPSDVKGKRELMKKMFSEIGEGCYFETPFHANHGGAHCHLGKDVYANFNLTLVDDTHIYIGDNTMLGPNVTIATAGHPINASLRKQAYQYNFPVHIGKNCWLGAGVIVLPGVTIGNNVVIGAGSVVTKDLPDNVVAVGNPCRILREVNERDNEFYFKNRKIDWGEITLK